MSDSRSDPWVWTAGELLRSSKLTVPINDRIFEHGLGAFETLRTWNGKPLLLGRHLQRLSQTAQDLGLPLNQANLPNVSAVQALIQANSMDYDCGLRITLTGGAPNGSSFLWMKTFPLTPNPTSLTLAACPWTLGWNDPLPRHKTLNYWSRRLAFEEASRQGVDDVVLATPDGRFRETSRMSLFLVDSGQLTTCADDGYILPGVFRGLILELAESLGLAPRLVSGWSPEEIKQANELFATNAVRGLIPTREFQGLGRYPAPGPIAQRLSAAFQDWIYHQIKFIHDY